MIQYLRSKRVCYTENHRIPQSSPQHAAPVYGIGHPSPIRTKVPACEENSAQKASECSQGSSSLQPDTPAGDDDDPAGATPTTSSEAEGPTFAEGASIEADLCQSVTPEEISAPAEAETALTGDCDSQCTGAAAVFPAVAAPAPIKPDAASSQQLAAILARKLAAACNGKRPCPEERFTNDEAEAVGALLALREPVVFDDNNTGDNTAAEDERFSNGVAEAVETLLTLKESSDFSPEGDDALAEEQLEAEDFTSDLDENNTGDALVALQEPVDSFPEGDSTLAAHQVEDFISDIEEYEAADTLLALQEPFDVYSDSDGTLAADQTDNLISAIEEYDAVDALPARQDTLVFDPTDDDDLAADQPDDIISSSDLDAAESQLGMAIQEPLDLSIDAWSDDEGSFKLLSEASMEDLAMHLWDDATFDSTHVGAAAGIPPVGGDVPQDTLTDGAVGTLAKRLDSQLAATEPSGELVTGDDLAALPIHATLDLADEHMNLCYEPCPLENDTKTAAIINVPFQTAVHGLPAINFESFDSEPAPMEVTAPRLTMPSLNWAGMSCGKDTVFHIADAEAEEKLESILLNVDDDLVYTDGFIPATIEELPEDDAAMRGAPLVTKDDTNCPEAEAWALAVVNGAESGFPQEMEHTAKLCATEALLAKVLPEGGMLPQHARVHVLLSLMQSPLMSESRCASTLVPRMCEAVLAAPASCRAALVRAWSAYSEELLESSVVKPLHHFIAEEVEATGVLSSRVMSAVKVLALAFEGSCEGGVLPASAFANEYLW